MITFDSSLLACALLVAVALAVFGAGSQRVHGQPAEEPAPDAPAADSVKHARIAEQFARRTHLYQGTTLPYRLFVPEGARGRPFQSGHAEGAPSANEYPLILALHGAGERGTDNETHIRVHRMATAWADSATQARHPAFVVAPQAPPERRWVNTPWDQVSYDLNATPLSDELAVVRHLLAHLTRTYPVDEHRIYVTGLSMGGYGTWDLVARFPDRFAAAVPMSGAGSPAAAEQIGALPIWAFHGARDDAVPVEGTRAMIEALREAGREPVTIDCTYGACAPLPDSLAHESLIYVEYPESGHVIWADSYELPLLEEWLFSKRNDQAPSPPAAHAPPAASESTATERAAPEERTSMLGPRERIVFFGDSITEMGAEPSGYITLVREALHERYPQRDLEVIGAGVGGDKVPDLLRRLDDDVLAHDPSLVVIYIGVNDVWHQFEFEEEGTAQPAYRSGLHRLIDQIRDQGAEVLLCTPSVIGEDMKEMSDPNAMLGQYADVVREVARTTGVRLCDLRAAFQRYLRTHNPEGRDQGVLTQDGVHLNAAGNRFVADRILRAMTGTGLAE